MKNFSSADLDALLVYASKATGFVTVPYVLAETSNLIGLGKSAQDNVGRAFERFVEHVEEIPVCSRDYVGDPYLARMGLTDTALLRLRSEKTEVLTVDFKLFGLLKSIGIAAHNLRHLSYGEL